MQHKFFKFYVIIVIKNVTLQYYNTILFSKVSLYHIKEKKYYFHLKNKPLYPLTSIEPKLGFEIHSLAIESSKGEISL